MVLIKKYQVISLYLCGSVTSNVEEVEVVVVFVDMIETVDTA